MTGGEAGAAGKEKQAGFELWAKGAFFLCGLAASLAVYLGLRPGGATAVAAYVYGPFVLGSVVALLFLGSLLLAAFRRPLIQRGRAKAWLALGACLWWCSYPFPYPSSHEGRPSPGTFHLPFDEPWDVSFAGDRPQENPLTLNPATRFGYGFRRVQAGEGDDAGRVLAPIAGRVVAVDGAPRAPERVMVRIEARAGETLTVAGLARDTLEVGAGDELAVGELLGLAQALTVFLADEHGEGIPLLFDAFTADGRAVERGEPRRGQRVQRAPESLVPGD